MSKRKYRVRLGIAISLAAAICLPAVAYCSDAAGGTVTLTKSIATVSGVQTGNVFLFATNGARPPVPACAVTGNLWVLDASTTGAQNAIAMILSAQAQGRTIWVHGTGSCTVWSDTESASVIDYPTP